MGECIYIDPNRRGEYAAFSSRLHRKALPLKTPIDGSIELTWRCNFACVHCYNNLPAGDKEARASELTREEIFQIIDQVAEEGCLWMLLTGGDPLLRPDFLEIYDYVKRKGILVTVFTNGTTLTPRVLDFLEKYPPFNLEITLYGATEETYQRVTGRRGVFQQVLKNIDRLLERKIPLQLKSTIISLNVEELEAMRSIAQKRRLPFRFNAEIHPRYDGSPAPLQYRLDPEKVAELDRQDAQRMEEYHAFVRDFPGLEAPTPELQDRMFHCGAGLTSFHITPYGKLQTCMLVHTLGHDLRENHFKDVWYGFARGVRAMKRKRRNYKCATCDIIALCGTCVGWSELEHGNKEAPIEFMCELTHRRAKQLGVAHDCTSHIDETVQEEPQEILIGGIKLPSYPKEMAYEKSEETL